MGVRTLDETGEEGLLLEVGICRVTSEAVIVGPDRGARGRTVGLEVLLGGGHELESDELEAVGRG